MAVPRRPGQTHREDLIGWEAKNRSGVKGRLVEVVHGYQDNKMHRRTLVVFEWRLLPGPGDDRIKNVEITVAFQAIGDRDGVRPGGKVTDYDLVPLRWAPNKPILSHFSQASVTEAVNTEFGGQAGYNPFLTLLGKRNAGSSQAVERIDYRYITGNATYVDKSAGTRNAMRWELSENTQLKSGVQYETRTAVLLRRQPLDFGKFNVTVKAKANGPLNRLLCALRIRPTDGPAAFDPTVFPGSSKGGSEDDDVAARATTHDWQKLDDVNLEEVLIKDWGVDSAEELEQKAAPESARGVSGA